MKKSLLAILSSALIFVSCNTTNYIVSESAAIKDYSVAAVNTSALKGSVNPALCGFEVSVFDALNKAGLKTLGENEFASLSEEELKGAFLVNTGYSVEGNQIVLSLSFVDFLSGRPIASVYGSGDIGLGYEKGILAASEKVTFQIKSMFAKVRAHEIVKEEQLLKESEVQNFSAPASETVEEETLTENTEVPENPAETSSETQTAETPAL